MNPKNTCILVVMAAALFAFIFFFERHLHKPEAGPALVMSGGFKPSAVTGLQLLLPNQKISLERTNGIWQIIYPLPYPAQSQAVEDLVRAAAALTPQTRISAQELKGRMTVNEEFGFDNPQATIVFQQGSEQFTLKLGSLTMPGDQIYVQVVGLANVDVIDADFFKKLVPRQVNDWRDTSFITLTNLAFDGLTVGSGSQFFELHRASASTPWRMTRPVQSRADNPKIAALLSALQNLRVTRFVTDDARADLEAYGLQPAAMDLKFDEGTNHVLLLQFGKSPTNDESQIYARRNGQNTIMLVPRARVSAWAAGFQEFRDSHLVRFENALPDVIEVQTNGRESFTVERQPNDSWRIVKPFDLPADTNLMLTFLQNLANLEVVRDGNQVAVSDTEPPDSPSPVYGLAKPARRYLLKTSANHTSSGATNQVIADLDFGSAKDGHIFARRADRPEESSVYAVKAVDYAKLPANAFQLRARRIWNFSENDVASVTIRQHGQATELMHKGTNEWAIAPGSTGIMNDPLMVEVGAQELGFLEAQSWIERGAQDRARYGFSDKSLQISVETKQNGKPQTLTLDVGGASPDGLRYGAVRMEDGQVWIFEFPAVTLDRLTYYFNIHENPGS